MVICAGTFDTLEVISVKGGWPETMVEDVERIWKDSWVGTMYVAKGRIGGQVGDGKKQFAIT